MFQPIAPLHDATAEMLREASFHPTLADIVTQAIGLTSDVIPPTWSITIELIGSALLPVFCFLATRRKSLFYGLIAVLTAVSLTGNHTGPLLYIVDFGAGVWLAVFPARIVEAWSYQKTFAAITFVLAILGILCLLDFNALGLPFKWMHAFELVCAFILVGNIVHGNLDFSLLRTRPAVWLGDISYSVYLLHVPILFALTRLAALAGWDRAGHPLLLNLGVACVVAVLTLPTAAFFYETIEKPGIEAGVALVSRLRR